MINARINFALVRRSLKSTSVSRTFHPISISVPTTVKRSFSQEPKIEDAKAPKGIIDRLFGPDSNYASENFKNRWLMAVPAFSMHLCLGAPWAWSLMADVISREIGLVAPAVADWTLMQAAFPLSMVFFLQGAVAALVGKWQVKVGARATMATAALFYGVGFGTAAAGLHMHSLPLLYTGFFFVGTGNGISYTPPLQTLLQWFPDKKGIGAGMVSAGFGAGGLLFTAIAQNLMKKFSKIPDYLGPVSDFTTSSIDGKLFASVDDKLIEVVLAGPADLAKLSFTGLNEGLYVVGSGSSGAAETMAIIGAGYCAAMMSAALLIKRPHPQFVAEFAAKAAATSSTAIIAAPDLTLDEAMKRSDFYKLFFTFTCLATGGMGVFSVAKPMMNEVFSSVLPTVVTSAFAAKFVMALSSGNLGGRLMWSAVSDVIGRRNSFLIFTAGSVPLYFFLPTITETVVTSGSVVPLGVFIGSTVVAMSIMGATFAVLPAYESDLFGTKNVGSIHGRMLFASSIAALAGPQLLFALRAYSEKNAIADILTKVSPEKFQATFGAPIEKASELLAAKTLSIGKVLALAPPGTIDPTPHLYDTTMYSLAGLMSVAFLAHYTVSPVGRSVKQVIDVKVVDEVKAVAPPVAEATVKNTEEVVGDRLVKK